MSTDGPRGICCPGACPIPLGNGLVKPRPSKWVPLSSPCSLSEDFPGESQRSLLQVSGVDAEPGSWTEEKQVWAERLEHLQQAVAQLEIEQSRLQHHNVQLQTTLEQVGLSHCPHQPSQGPVSMYLHFLCSPLARVGKL